jgi:acetyl-CoA C-acetyltransferase
MQKVAAIGIGQTKVEEQWEKSLRDLAGEASLAALEDSGLPTVEGIYVGNMMSGSANNQMQLGAYLSDWIGARFSEAIHLESACSSGAAAFRAAVMAVASGEINSALAVGVEKMSDSPIAEITSSLATAADADWEVTQGISFVGLNALIMQRYLHEYKWEHGDFAEFSINAHANAMNNPNARFHMMINREQFEKAGFVADPINLLDASPTGDGSAAVILIPEASLKPIPGMKIISVAGSGAATDTISVHNRKDPLWLKAAEISVKKAYSQANLGPGDIDLFEYHDAFTIMCALSLEACGFIERGQGPRLALDGEIKLNGRIPVATQGGLKARGHPVGATGMYQIVEIIQQLRGQAGKNQVENARIGMAQNIGGSGSNIITHILRTE